MRQPGDKGQKDWGRWASECTAAFQSNLKGLDVSTVTNLVNMLNTTELNVL